MVDGFLIIDKPAGLSSHDVVNRVRRVLGTKKVGHTGTLDPFATGVLPIAVGEATKAIQFLDEGRKAYEAVIHFGRVTDTLDCTGAVVREGDTAHLTQAALLQHMAALTGAIRQVPPMYSALKQGGQPLYKLARKGVEVERPAREITVYRFELHSFAAPLATVVAECSRGTYIRSLADDLGALLGCGASLDALRRLSSGPFSLSQALTLEELAAYGGSGTVHEHVIGISAALPHLEHVPLSGQDLLRLQHGIPPRSLLQSRPAGWYCLVGGEGRVKAVAEVTAGQDVVLKRVFN